MIRLINERGRRLRINRDLIYGGYLEIYWTRRRK